MNTIRFLFIALILLAWSGCAPDEPTGPQDKTLELHIDFWNSTGNNPEIRFDAAASSSEIKIDFTQTFAGVALSGNITNVIIDNVRIIDNDNVNYEIERITAYEYRDDLQDWKEDVEFIMNFEEVEDLNVILVLDASASLGTDFTKVKSFAQQFVNKTFTETPSAEIGVVAFSDVIQSQPLTNNRNALNSYIDNIPQGPFTSLYEAINTGVDELQANTAEGKAILTFTDGTDNNSSPSITPTFLIDKLESDTNNIKITSFTIGLDGRGGLDKPILENLAVNGGAAAFPTDITELETVFESFSKSISNVYNLTYIRNKQIVPASDPVRVKFEIKATPK